MSEMQHFLIFLAALAGVVIGGASLLALTEVKETLLEIKELLERKDKP